MRRFRDHLTYANVVSTLCLFSILAGGAAYAVATIGSADIINESIRSQDIRNGQVRSSDIGNHQVKEADLLVPAQFTSVLPDGNCLAADEWRDVDFFNEVGYYRDPFGIVHLQGTGLKCGTPTDRLFTLPAGYRPEDPVDTNGVKNGTDFHQVRIQSSGEVEATTPGFASFDSLSLEGITFRCGPSGQDGCP